MKEIKFTAKNEKVNNEILQTEDLTDHAKVKIICEKLVICGGALTLAHGILSADAPFFYAGIIVGTAAFTALQCSQLEMNKLNNNKKVLLRTLYHNK